MKKAPLGGKIFKEKSMKKLLLLPVALLLFTMTGAFACGCSVAPKTTSIAPPPSCNTCQKAVKPKCNTCEKAAMPAPCGCPTKCKCKEVKINPCSGLEEQTAMSAAWDETKVVFHDTFGLLYDSSIGALINTYR